MTTQPNNLCLKKTREQIRNERAEKVCRELRHYLLVKDTPQEEPADRLHKLLVSWMSVTGKVKYERPKHTNHDNGK